ncbi:DNA cytosine methyltransferase [Pandoraea terrae]
MSAEMDPFAHQTLRLRAFYRELKRSGAKALQPYYDYCNYGAPIEENAKTAAAWKAADEEALQLTLGNPTDNAKLDAAIRGHGIGPDSAWILIGGPPCQAYSLVGRARNKGKVDYKPEDDHRHFLYKEYLRIIQKYRPSVFVMENVKGILSSSVGGERVFHSILRDLADPDAAILGKRASSSGYRIYSLSHDVAFDRHTDPSAIDARKFIVRAEDYGIPQARHRVILLGVREDLDQRKVRFLRPDFEPAPTVVDAIGALPPLRSRLSKQSDEASEWAQIVRSQFKELATAAKARNMTSIADALQRHSQVVSSALGFGDVRVPKTREASDVKLPLREWLEDRRLHVWLNHEARGHMKSDLMRYAYASTFAAVNERSPKGHEEFDLLEKLRPDHANWETGKFSDRFRVQLATTSSTTITSHISKDGHYFIHPDPTQCRSLTVREAARLQTFPDNYFFQGNRTQQYHQVGNAVPPLFAHRIAELVRKIL